MSNRKSAIVDRLSGYWKMELGNVLLLPAAMIALSYIQGYSLGWLSFISIVPMAGLLVIGGLYWRAKLLSVQGLHTPLFRTMALAAKLQWPLAVSSFSVAALCLISWLYPSMSASFGDRCTASIAAALAVLEYINYYHRQLQHFDHAADWKRLLQGEGFRPAQMAVDLTRYRNGVLRSV
ncbi:hypothetical protein [Parerythrobacter jejuensis]|uniref:Uncharacterized protein n=1 Tax=Parerythrobacter jejuensis TaxID=795812 RepID=A0A845AP08_9SPHN|nr:hypothetical protein [Parerythrobacter jejuensis]MXP32552.1 hypothetical protein [Parerythrobacter jejuensis]